MMIVRKDAENMRLSIARWMFRTVEIIREEAIRLTREVLRLEERIKALQGQNSELEDLLDSYKLSRKILWEYRRHTRPDPRLSAP